jgi:hypothetical protein
MAKDASSTRVSLFSRSSDHPRSPNITYGELLKQFKADVHGKEVQSAATYSYMWMADQMGHVCVGIIGNMITTFGARNLWHFLSWQHNAEAGGLFAAIAIVAAWETSTYFSCERSSTGLFPLGRKLLRDNAIIATLYMSLGAIIGFGFHIGIPWAGVFLLVCTVIAIWVAPAWLRQKIIWQKAALPYLSRLADIEPTMGKDAAKILQALIDEGAPPAVKPCQIVIGGPVGSGRTQLAAGIGTEFAFKKVKTRYVSIQSLLEFAAAAQPPQFPDDPGPVNVNYWPWSEAQVVIIDDIGPLIAPQRDQQEAMLEHFRGILNQELKPVADVLARCHTVWVIGDLGRPGSTVLAGEVLDEFARVIAAYGGGERKPLVIELKAISAAEPTGVAAARVASAAAAVAGDSPRPKADARYVSTSRSEANGDVKSRISSL